ncbi:lysylphosphatidylglycerol synthetase-like protein (DUF2156 family) [Evansella vedderi]|uniref:Lysylphosphatidylglycerol synthetase-like protein (DUF2156 family) n=1 Tax=Evansella vedderi TaxID=38282 RepID=A0ABT9ZZY3_9BACI|nr:hypothetical protein [Evansella vedderi]MDQ0256802.1 lysylphosphatidylglycerol synthetase-like protein (DUF2156 family) [Evansella vedderi]
MTRVNGKRKEGVKEIVNNLQKEGIDAEVCTRMESEEEQVES